MLIHISELGFKREEFLWKLALPHYTDPMVSRSADIL